MDASRRVAELEREEEEQRRRAEELQRHAEEQQRRADELRRRADELQRHAEEQRRRADRAEQETSQTTLIEYIEACHNFVFTKFAVETDKSLTSPGWITSPQDKLCPTRLTPWVDFLHQQKTLFGRLLATFPTRAAEFQSRAAVRGIGEAISLNKVANEGDLVGFQDLGVEFPVQRIVKQLATKDAMKAKFDVGDGITFENHPHALGSAGSEVLARERVGPASISLQQLQQLRADRICVSKRGTNRITAYIIEYKPPHKLTPEHLRVGLRPMNICEEVVNRTTRPTTQDPVALFAYHADRLTAAAVAQTFNYMIEGGLDYGLLTTGETMVFLKIDWSDPGLLYYHLAEPGPEVQAHPRDWQYCTAVSQLLAFTLMALGPPGQKRHHGQDERCWAKRRLPTWSEDWESILRSIPSTERNAPPSSQGYQPRTYSGVDRSPYPLRWRDRASEAEPGVGAAGRRLTPESSDDEAGTRETSSPSERRSGTRGGQGRQYCTQKCLLGLVGRGRLDEACPNVALHRTAGDGAHHPIDHATWLALLREQLKRTLDDGVERLGKEGARGVLFRVTLLAHGYTFVSKGTVETFVGDLEHEVAVYGRLRPIQGVCTPVCLGAVDLRTLSRMYFYDHRVRIVYMMFLSWGGESLKDVANAALEAVGTNPGEQLVRSVQALHALGVAHTDVRRANALWNSEVGRVMMIDFERAILRAPPRRPLSVVAPNKRPRAPRKWYRKGVVRQRADEEWNQRVQEDVYAAESIISH